MRGRAVLPPSAGAPSGWAVRRLIDRVGVVQIDSVNVLQRAHYLPLFSRFGPYDTALLDRSSHYAPRRLFEYWGHEASLLPVALQPALRWRMDRAEHERPERTGPWWDWSDVKRAFEWLFWSGRITAARRRGFERLYDLPERVLPRAVLATPTPPEDEAQRQLLRI